MFPQAVLGGSWYIAKVILLFSCSNMALDYSTWKTKKVMWSMQTWTWHLANLRVPITWCRVSQSCSSTVYCHGCMPIPSQTRYVFPCCVLFYSISREYDVSEKLYLSLPDMKCLKMYYRRIWLVINFSLPDSYMLYAVVVAFLLASHITLISIFQILLSKFSFEISLPPFSKTFFLNRDQRLEHTSLGCRWRKNELTWLTWC